jgi:hypothetical protein
MVVITRLLASSFVSALRSPPDKALGGVSGPSAVPLSAIAPDIAVRRILAPPPVGPKGWNRLLTGNRGALVESHIRDPSFPKRLRRN